MKIAIMGAGAMGSLFGAHLAGAGHDVLLVDVDPVVVAAVEADGILLGERAVPVPITADPVGRGTYDAVVVLVKTYDTEAAAGLAAPLVGPATVVATLQNGIGGADVLAEAFGPERVLAGVTYQGATVLAPGRIRHHMHGETFLGDDVAAAAPLAAALTEGGQPAHALDPVAPRIWKKLTNNCMGNCTSALTGMSGGQMAGDDGILALQRAIATEAVAVAAGARARPRPRGLRAHQHVRAGLVGRRAAVDAPGRRGGAAHGDRDAQRRDRPPRRRARDRRARQPRHGRARPRLGARPRAARVATWHPPRHEPRGTRPRCAPGPAHGRAAR